MGQHNSMCWGSCMSRWVGTGAASIKPPRSASLLPVIRNKHARITLVELRIGIMGRTQRQHVNDCPSLHDPDRGEISSSKAAEVNKVYFTADGRPASLGNQTWNARQSTYSFFDQAKQACQRRSLHRTTIEFATFYLLEAVAT